MLPLKSLLVAAAFVVTAFPASAVPYHYYTFHHISGAEATGRWTVSDRAYQIGRGSDWDSPGTFSLDTGVIGDLWWGDFMTPAWTLSEDRTVFYLNGGFHYSVIFTEAYSSFTTFFTDDAGIFHWTWTWPRVEGAPDDRHTVTYTASGTGIWLRSDINFEESEGEAVPDAGRTGALLIAGFAALLFFRRAHAGQH